MGTRISAIDYKVFDVRLRTEFAFLCESLSKCARVGLSPRDADNELSTYTKAGRVGP